MHLLMLDLDRFKEANDRYGHLIGDMILQEVARRLKQCVRSSDVVARFGGDEFSIVLPDSGSDAMVALICQKILDTIAQPFVFSEGAIKIGISIGIARFPGDATDPRGISLAADRALYLAKASGRNAYHFVDRAGA